MSAPAPAKFTFDVDMSAHRGKTSVVSEKKLAAMLDAVRKEGFDEGLKAGMQSAEAEAQRAFPLAIENLLQQAVALHGAMDKTHRQALGHAAEIGQTIGKKLSAHLVARYPEAELAAVIADSMRSLEQAPHLVIRCHPDLVEPINKIAEAQAATSGFSGRLLVMGEPEIGLGDGRLEWADGGLVRDTSAIAEEIDTVVSAWLDAQVETACQGEDQ